MAQTIGTVIAVSGSQMTVLLDAAGGSDRAIGIGSLITVPGAHRDVIGMVSSLELEPGPPARRTVTADLLGEIGSSPKGERWFGRGITHYPVSGEPVHAATHADLDVIYARSSRSNIRIGTLYNDPGRPVFVQVDDLLAKHFAVLGTTGSGKSCAVTLMLSAILNDHPNAHIILLDPHNEYSTAFADVADLVNVDNLRLPFWLFNFEEAVRILVHGGTMQEQESQAIILKEALTKARRHYAGDNAGSISVDTPVPYRIPDLLRFLDEGMGRLDKADGAAPYLRLRTRLESLRDDRRFSFMFSDRLNTPDRLSEVVGRLLRIPVGGKPLTIVDISGVPSEIADVVVSLSCRMMFDFAAWSEHAQMPPILLVCEEAHRYVPADERVGFAATTRAVTRIAKEGRKYGLSLALISQRPAELSPEALSQCGTVFALRLGNDLDQEFMARTVPDAARGMLTALPNLPTQQAIVSGEGVALPMRIRFDDLPPGRRPRSEGAPFSQAWQTDSADTAFREDGIRRWRLQSRQTENAGTSR